MIRVGTAGWSYPDWEGVVYPKGTATSREALVVLARLFETVEINVTFYRPPTPRMSESWVQRVAPLPSFRFAAKLWQGFTHRRDEKHTEEEKTFKEGIRPLMEARRLGALLAQFPHSFHGTPANRCYLESLMDRFSDYPIVVELRHSTWMNEETRALLAGRGVGFCNVDQPLVGSASPPTTVMTADPGYVRLHGRNRKNWFRRDAGRDARYDYLYSHEQIREWVERVRMMQRKSKGNPDIFIIANNHYRGQAPANALELMSVLADKKVEAPSTIVEAFPHLREFVTLAETPGMLPL